MQQRLCFALLVTCVLLCAQSASASVTLGTANTTALSNGLVGYWTFDGPSLNWKTNTVSDVSGNGNTGALVSLGTTTAPVVGKIAQALKFNGSSQYLAIPNSSSLTPATFTASSWIYVTGGENTYRDIVSKGGSGTQSWAFQINTTTNNTECWVSANGSTLVSAFGTTQFTAASGNFNKWFHITCTYDGSTVRVYVNGVQQGTASVSGTIFSSTNTITIGRWSGASTDFFRGSIDDVRIYNRALSAQEVALLYALGSANAAHSNTVTLNTGLVGYWTFDGPSLNWKMNTVSEVSGNGNTGSLVNMSTTSSVVLGKIGQALKFNGSTASYVNAGTIASYPLTIFTDCAWVNPSNTATNRTIIAGSGNSFPQFRISNTNVLQLLKANIVGVGATTATVSSGVWSFVCVSYDASGNYKFYINGAVSSSGTNLQIFSNSNFQIGIQTSLGEKFSGTIDDVRIYNRVLSSQEVQQLYALGQANVAHSNTTAQIGINSGLVGYWTFDGPSMNWRTNTTADSSGNGNTGTLVSLGTTTAPAIGKIGQALKFNGSTRNISTSNKVVTTSDFSFSVWVKNGSTSQAIDTTILTNQNDTNNYGLVFAQRGAGNAYSIFYGNGSGTWINIDQNRFALPLNTWTHVAFTKLGANTSIYINGVVWATLTQGSSIVNFTNANNFRIGSGITGVNRFFMGSVDDVRTYNRALSAAEVKQLYLTGK